MKTIWTISIVLALAGCGGGEFTAADFTGTAGSGSAVAGQTGEAGEGTGGSQEGRPGAAGDDSGGNPAGMGGDETNPVGGNVGLSGSDMGGIGGMGTAGSVGTGGSSVVPDPICTPSEGRCSGLDYEICSNDGSAWEKHETCGSVCTSMGCIGNCKPGTNKCDGKDSLTCDAMGSWKKTATCPFICGGAGECRGSCLPGSSTCLGNIPQKCSDEGEPVNGTACPNLCSSGACTGACNPGQKECNGNKTRTCQANGTWKETGCSFVCQGAGVCGGICIPGEKHCDGLAVQVCTVQGQWETESSCPYLCQAGACTGTCKPGNSCADDGNSCTEDICAADATTCTHPAKTNGISCGSSTNNECNKPDTCQAGACQANFAAAGTSCISDGNACTIDACDGTGSCGHKPGNNGTVCRVSSCSNGQIFQEATCDGTSTACPASVKSDCYGSCDAAGQMCSAGLPTKMADSYTMLALDNDNQYVYASIRDEGSTAKIRRIRKSDNAQTTLYQDNNGGKWIYALALAGNHLYLGETQWTGGSYTGKVTRIDTVTANQSPVFLQTMSTFGFAKNSARIYWSDATPQPCDCDNPPIHHVYSTPINGDGTVTTFQMAFTIDMSPDIEVSDTNLYVWEMTGHTAGAYRPSLNRYGLSNPSTNAAGLIAGYFIKNGSQQQDTVSAVGDVPALTKNSNSIFANVAFGSGTAVLSVSASDTVTLLGTDSQAAPSSNFLADASYVYFGNERISVNGGSFAYTSSHSIAALTMDATNLYFGSYGYWTALPYSGGADFPLKAFFRIKKN